MTNSFSKSILSDKMTQEKLKPQAVYFSLGLNLRDIPEPETPHEYDGGTKQREFIDFEVSAGGLTVAADKIPGYGCTECGIKFWDSEVSIRALVKSARIFSRHGNKMEARRLMQEARDLIRISP